MHFMKSATLILGLGAFPLWTAGPAGSQGMPAEQVKQILQLTKADWVSFRNWEGQQLVYFTLLESWRCGIDYVFYGLDEGPLDHMWELDECDPDNPHKILKNKPYIELPADSVQSISVQLIFPDGSKTSIETFQYKP